ncbi:Rv2253/PknI dimerization domain-containing protein [Mycolicibacterium confluentis]|uniref:Uncharacterized protein n=1 Tax=Mycolicibacterium confluentis TaxID=28047 RepID=A0A7I7XTS4_9MYCO|nr:hypothetical protein [Mycolicibacterium confluentis]MCV7322088.1 hypothetical protein [Mycolicibacterium confluentis]ORV27800.1 hypothetical protein AWB99_19445 [Mycolicibacterium confluentis]BBZ32571.1 hypothetical protein MCNF_11760 [Mycolicibacterium confluentis]
MSASPLGVKTMALAASVGLLGAGLMSAAPASAQEWGINGTFATSSNGDWAMINDRYEDQPSIRSTWTISTSCTSPSDCAGTVTSDQGWTAPIYTTNGLWYIKRAVPNWRYCADGVPVEGLQTYKFYPVSSDARFDPTYTTNEFTGEDRTIGPSGSCGRNQWPVIRIPFYMKKI